MYFCFVICNCELFCYMAMSTKHKVNILDLFDQKKIVKICAPMVRYSKLQFRNLVRLYDCDLAYTPMILADSFCRSEKARKNEFTTNLLDTPLIAQFATNTVHDFVGAAYLASPYCDGVDLNCGCPQRWAREQGIGCEMLKNPEQIYNIVRQCRNSISEPFSISVKLRLLNNVKDSVEICRQLEMCGVSFLTVHARTPTQIVGKINKTALKLIKDSCNVPVVANGGVTSLQECENLQQETDCDGVMVANGLLTNPTLFSGSLFTTKECIQNWLDICYNSTLILDASEVEDYIPEKPYNLTFQCFHHHLVFMLEKILPRKKKQVFNNLKTFKDVLNFIEDYYDLKPRLYDPKQLSKSALLNVDYFGRDSLYKDLKPVDVETEVDYFTYNSESGNGKYFESKIRREDPDSDCEWANIFLENG